MKHAIPSTIKLTGKFKVHTPKLREKVEMYENFLHRINAACVSMNDESIKKLIANADAWSYAHRVGNGEYSDIQQQRIINNAFYRLLET